MTVELPQESVTLFSDCLSSAIISPGLSLLPLRSMFTHAHSPDHHCGGSGGCLSLPLPFSDPDSVHLQHMEEASLAGWAARPSDQDPASSLLLHCIVSAPASFWSSSLLSLTTAAHPHLHTHIPRPAQPHYQQRRSSLAEHHSKSFYCNTRKVSCSSPQDQWNHLFKQIDSPSSLYTFL